MGVPSKYSSTITSFTDGRESCGSPTHLDPSMSKGYKHIYDPIHGYIKLDSYVIDFIDTPQFQRLRDLKQLGSAYFVFPGASHNRFEHSIGVSHLSNKMVQQLKSHQPELGISDRDVRCITLAGLCHDLGHGPFSHVFDRDFIPCVRPGYKWEHENASEMMLEYLIDDNNIDIEKDDINFIKDLIVGTKRSSREEKAFLFDIVANKRNSIDVDKFDYIQRDCHSVGHKGSYDYSRLMFRSRVIDDQICFNYKEVYDLFDMYQTRFRLFKQIYNHRAAKEIELMLVDAMVAADPVLKISEMIDCPQEYLYLTDNIIGEIESSRDPALKESKDIVSRVRRRDLYKFVDEFTIPPAVARYIEKSKVTPSRIVEYRDVNDDLSESDIIVRWGRLHYGMGPENPIKHIRFFADNCPHKSFNVTDDTVSLCMPANFEENKLQIFTRDPKKRQSAQRATRRFMEEFNIELSQSHPIMACAKITPHKGDTLPEVIGTPKGRRLLF
ncbi:hypothetical protein H4219_001542 [Mycoemilia scoparia]|uniref:HD/PDEase domain-containing protein n=1 Tax=Mycoemilia scoparia TaxID=417184 RepID=A0A9W8A6I1_9FUNG|nr:hypothetical protein H4219_001542 [Mycoemilia scoparia]